MGNIIPGVPTPSPPSPAPTPAVKCDSCCKPCNSCCPKPTPCPPATQQSAVWCGNEVIAGSDAKYDMPTTNSGMCQCNPGAGKYAMLQDCQRDLIAEERRCSETRYADCAAPCVQIDGQICASKYSPYSYITPTFAEVQSSNQIVVRGPMRIGAGDVVNAFIKNETAQVGIDVPDYGIQVLTDGILITLETNSFVDRAQFSIYFTIRNARTGQVYTSKQTRFEKANNQINIFDRRYAY